MDRTTTLSEDMGDADTSSVDFFLHALVPIACFCFLSYSCCRLCACNAAAAASVPTARRATLPALPKLRYGEVKRLEMATGELGCSVCLCELEDSEFVRVFPGCRHVFHSKCIDPWLNSHLTCPLCRSEFFPGLAAELRLIAQRNSDGRLMQQADMMAADEDLGHVVSSTVTFPHEESARRGYHQTSHDEHFHLVEIIHDPTIVVELKTTMKSP